jgi:uncharacterized membrane protein YccC
MDIAAAWNAARTLSRVYRPQLRFCVRMTVAALAAFAVAQVLSIPLHGVWAVLTALVVTQVSVGGSVRATVDYLTGTLGGAIYASAVGVLIPHETALSLAGVLALTVAPLAGAAALSPRFRVAPFTAAMVLLLSSELGGGPVESALFRTLEVAIGGAVAVAVALWVFPERAHGLGLAAAVRILEQLARGLPVLLSGCTRKTDRAEVQRIQDDSGRGIAGFQALAEEARRERLYKLASEPDSGPLSRTLLRLRHDLVMIGRAGIVPLPDAVAARLGPPLSRLGASASEYLRASAAALAARRPPPLLGETEAALAAFEREIEALRQEGLTRTLTSSEVEHLFALGFVLEQLHQHFADLGRCIEEWAQPLRADKSSQAGLRSA